jgi:hypothetical protein
MEAEVGEQTAMTAPPCTKQAPGESKTNRRNVLKNKSICKRICYLSVCLSEVYSQCSLLCLQFHEMPVAALLLLLLLLKCVSSFYSH